MFNLTCNLVGLLTAIFTIAALLCWLFASYYSSIKNWWVSPVFGGIGNRIILIAIIFGLIWIGVILI